MVLVQGAEWQAGKVSRLQINQSRTATESALVVEVLLLVVARITEILCLLRNFATGNLFKHEVGDSYKQSNQFFMVKTVIYQLQQSNYTPDLFTVQNNAKIVHHEPAAKLKFKWLDRGGCCRG